MQLFELVSPKLFRPLAGPNRAYYAELLLLLWEVPPHGGLQPLPGGSRLPGGGLLCRRGKAAGAGCRWGGG